MDVDLVSPTLLSSGAKSVEVDTFSSQITPSLYASNIALGRTLVVATQLVTAAVV